MSLTIEELNGEALKQIQQVVCKVFNLNSDQLEQVIFSPTVTENPAPQRGVRVEIAGEPSLTCWGTVFFRNLKGDKYLFDYTTLCCSWDARVIFHPGATISPDDDFVKKFRAKALS